MANLFKGEIYRIDETQQVSEKFQKREFIVKEKYDSKWGPVENPVDFVVVQEKCSLLDEFRVGDKVQLSFDLEGRLWTPPGEGEKEKCFSDHRVWKIEAVAGEGKNETPKEAPKKEAFNPNPPQGDGDLDSDLPF